MPKTKVSTRDVQIAKDTDNGEEVSFRGGGIKLTPIEPMRKWRLEFEGNLRSLVSSKIIMNQKGFSQQKCWPTILAEVSYGYYEHFYNQGWQGKKGAIRSNVEVR